MHYLQVDPDKSRIIHRARQRDGTLLTRIVTAGIIALDPPGFILALSDVYAAA
jgi:hypothetical protein